MTEDTRTERLRALVNAIVAGIPQGTKLVTPEEEKRNLRETTEISRKRIAGLLDAVVNAKVLSEMTGRPAQLEHPQLMQLARILAGILNNLDGTTKRAAGRPHPRPSTDGYRFLVERAGQSESGAQDAT